MSTPEHQVAVAISPADAKVTVDGEPHELSAGGKLQLSGKPGTFFAVVVTYGEDKLERMVGITTAGKASPSTLTLAVPPAGWASASAGPQPAPSKPWAKGPKAPPTKPTTTDKPAPTAAPTKPTIGKEWR